jgi:hypothetical protein
MNSKISLQLIATLIATTFWGVVLSFKSYFFFNPLDASSTLRQVELVTSSVGWVLISTGAPIALLTLATGRTALLRVLPFLALVWPVSVAFTQLTLRIQDGVWYTGYLTTSPVFLVTEVVIPVTLLVVWNHLRSVAAESH